MIIFSQPLHILWGMICVKIGGLDASDKVERTFNAKA